MRLSANAQNALDKVVQQFKSGDLSPIVEIARIQREGDPIPSDKWTLSNRIIAFVQTGSLDNRGYQQWKRVGRHVRKGERAAFILAPVTVQLEDEKSGEKVQVLKGFRAVAVFGYEQTEGEDLPVVDYTPVELPPLVHVAEKWGVEITYQPLLPGRLGACHVEGTHIKLGSRDPQIFFHELAYLAHARLDGRLKGGQDPHQETTAELSAAVLMELYGLGDRSGNCWNYIKCCAKDPLTAIVKALATVEKVLALLLDGESDPNPA